MSEDIVGKRKKYNLDHVVHSQSETIRAKEVGRCVGRSLVRFGAKHCPHEVKVEISGAWVVGRIVNKSKKWLVNVAISSGEMVGWQVERGAY